LRRLEALLGKAGLASLNSPSREQVEELRQVTLAYPDGLVFYLLGIMEFNAGRLPEAEAAFRMAATGDSLVSVRRAALYAMTFCRWELHDREAAAAAVRLGELVREVGECLRRWPRVGRPRLHAAELAVQAWARSVEFKRQALEGVQGLVRFGRLTPSEAELAASVALAMGEVDLARSLVREWERVAPGDLDAARKRMIVEFKAGSYATAIRASESVLEKQPGDRRALEYRDEATRRLRAQVDKKRPINPP
jgi:tetratricopeptide (TPR) repeat protein